MTTADAAPECSVVVVSYRCRDLLRTCLDSLNLQRVDVDLEVEVIDNASGDGTLPEGTEYPWARLTASPTNLGFAKATNWGIQRARGRAVLVLNPDTRLPSGSLRACLDALWARSDVGILSPRLIDEEGRLDRRSRRGFPTFWGSLCYFTGADRFLRGRRSRAYTLGWLPEDREADVTSVSGAFMLCRRDALHDVGTFDEAFFMYAEDMDLCLRMARGGWRVVYWPGADVIHVGAGSNVDGRRPREADTAFFRTMAPFMRKHRPGIRGFVTATAVRLCAEVMLAASRLSRRPARGTGNAPQKRR